MDQHVLQPHPAGTTSGGPYGTTVVSRGLLPDKVIVESARAVAAMRTAEDLHARRVALTVAALLES